MKLLIFKYRFFTKNIFSINLYVNEFKEFIKVGSDHQNKYIDAIYQLHQIFHDSIQ